MEKPNPINNKQDHIHGLKTLKGRVDAWIEFKEHNKGKSFDGELKRIDNMFKESIQSLSASLFYGDDIIKYISELSE